MLYIVNVLLPIYVQAVAIQLDGSKPKYKFLETPLKRCDQICVTLLTDNLRRTWFESVNFHTVLNNIRATAINTFRAHVSVYFNAS